MIKFSYVYMLESLSNPGRYYVGFTENLKDRLAKHNGGEVSHSSKYSPWRIKTAIAFRNIDSAHAFERYLKTASGRAFAKKHF